MEFLQPGDIENLSCVNKRLRNVSIPILFRAVRFELSKFRLNGLKRLSYSDTRHHVLSLISLIYLASKILKPGGTSSRPRLSYSRAIHRTEIMDLVRSTSDIIMPDDYADWVFEARDFMSDGCPSYMHVHDVLRDMCEEQQDIMRDDLDKSALFSIFTQLPPLKTMRLRFVRQ